MTSITINNSIISVMAFILMFFIKCVESKQLQTTDIFNTLDQIVEYTKTHPEYPDIDNNDWSKPDYNSFYQENLPSRLTSFLRFIRFKNRPLWDAKRFKKLLKNITTQRNSRLFLSRTM